MTSRKLTAKQEAFTNARIAGMGVSESYRHAYHAGGMSDKAVSVSANRLEQDPRIRLEVEKSREDARSSAVMTRTEALERLSMIARSGMKDVATFRKIQVGEDENGDAVMQSVWEIKDSETMTDIQSSVVSEVSVGKDGLKLKTHSQTGAIKQLSEMEGWNAASKHEHAGKDGGPIEVNRVERIIVDPANTNS